MTNIKERILQIADYKGISKEKFFEDLGVSYGNFKGKSKNTPLNSNTIVDILTKYNEVNSDWLLFGKQPMLKQDIDAVDADNTILLKVIKLQDELMEEIKRNRDLLTENLNLKNRIKDMDFKSHPERTMELERKL